jgi:hypothetical protein
MNERPLYTNGPVSLLVGTTVLRCDRCPRATHERVIGEPSIEQIRAFEVKHSHGAIVAAAGRVYAVGQLLVVPDAAARSVAILCPCGERRAVPGSLFAEVQRFALEFRAEHRCTNGATA